MNGCIDPCLSQSHYWLMISVSRIKNIHYLFVCLRFWDYTQRCLELTPGSMALIPGRAQKSYRGARNPTQVGCMQGRHLTFQSLCILIMMSQPGRKLDSFLSNIPSEAIRIHRSKWRFVNDMSSFKNIWV